MGKGISEFHGCCTDGKLKLAFSRKVLSSRSRTGSFLILTRCHHSGTSTLARLKQNNKTNRQNPPRPSLRIKVNSDVRDVQACAEREVSDSIGKSEPAAQE